MRVPRQAHFVSQAEARNSAELLVKVKEPVAAEYGFLRPDLVLFTYLHLAADRPLTEVSTLERWRSPTRRYRTRVGCTFLPR